MTESPSLQEVLTLQEFLRELKQWRLNGHRGKAGCSQSTFDQLYRFASRLPPKHGNSRRDETVMKPIRADYNLARNNNTNNDMPIWKYFKDTYKVIDGKLMCGKDGGEDCEVVGDERLYDIIKGSKTKDDLKQKAQPYYANIGQLQKIFLASLERQQQQQPTNGQTGPSGTAVPAQPSPSQRRQEQWRQAQQPLQQQPRRQQQMRRQEQQRRQQGRRDGDSNSVPAQPPPAQRRQAQPRLQQQQRLQQQTRRQKTQGQEQQPCQQGLRDGTPPQNGVSDTLAVNVEFHEAEGIDFALARRVDSIHRNRHDEMLQIRDRTVQALKKVMHRLSKNPTDFEACQREYDKILSEHLQHVVESKRKARDQLIMTTNTLGRLADRLKLLYLQDKDIGAEVHRLALEVQNLLLEHGLQVVVGPTRFAEHLRRVENDSQEEQRSDLGLSLSPGCLSSENVAVANKNCEVGPGCVDADYRRSNSSFSLNRARWQDATGVARRLPASENEDLELGTTESLDEQATSVTRRGASGAWKTTGLDEN